MKYVCFVYDRWMHFISPRKARVRVTSDQRVATKLWGRTPSVTPCATWVQNLCKIWSWKSKFSTLVPEDFKKVIRENAFKQERNKPRLKSNFVLALIGPSNNRAITTQKAVKWCETSQISLKLRRKTENHSQLTICTLLKNFYTIFPEFSFPY